MKNENRIPKIFKGVICRVLLLLSLATACPALAEIKDEQLGLKSLADKVSDLSSRLLSKETSNNTLCKDQASIKSLVDEIKKLDKDYPNAIICIRNSLGLIEENIDDDLVAEIVWYLYKSHEQALAEELQQIAVDNFSDYTKSRIQYQKAKYLFLNHDWSGVITTLQKTDIELTLKQKESDYAYYMTGVALQELQQHRDALKVYSVIEPASDYYSATQINIAVANIRQGWWTDAQLALENAIRIEKKQKNYDLVDRMYLVLGYSQMQQEFYTNARRSFREVGIDSPYVNRALLGIGLSAMHLKDYKNALNAFSLLSDKTPVDSFVQQAYLLMPYVHEKLGEKRLAEGKYTQAATYFKNKVAEIEAALNVSNSVAAKNSLAVARIALSEADDNAYVKNKLNLINYDADYLLNTALSMVETVGGRRVDVVSSELNGFKNDFLKRKNALDKKDFEDALIVYQDYFNQCQYALARLYDETL